MTPDSQRDPNIVQTATLCVIIVVGVMVILRLLLWRDPVTIKVTSGESDFDTAGALAYSQRIAQVAELTIATVLTLGAAVLGLNWYTSKRNFDEERARVTDFEQRTIEHLNKRIDSTLEPIDARVKMLEEIAENTDTSMARYLMMAMRMNTFTTAIFSNRLPVLLATLFTSLNIVRDGHADDATKQDATRIMVTTFIQTLDRSLENDAKTVSEPTTLEPIRNGVQRLILQTEDRELIEQWSVFTRRLDAAFDPPSTGTKAPEVEPPVNT